MAEHDRVVLLGARPARLGDPLGSELHSWDRERVTRVNCARSQAEPERKLGRELGSATITVDATKPNSAPTIFGPVRRAAAHATLGWTWADPLVAVVIAGCAPTPGATGTTGCCAGRACTCSH